MGRDDAAGETGDSTGPARFVSDEECGRRNIVRRQGGVAAQPGALLFPCPPRITRPSPAAREWIADIDWIITDTELEALILECNLIKKYRPRFNVRLRDDKHYPYICVTLTENTPG